MAPQQWLAHDLYAVLGVPDDITDEGLKHAYRGMVRRHHPDVNAGCPRSELKFKEVCAAYAVLSDRTSRTRYDRTRHWARHRAAAAGGRSRPAARPSAPGPDGGGSTATGPTAAAAGQARTADVPVTSGPGGTAAFAGWGPMAWAPGLWAFSVWTSAARTTKPGRSDPPPR